MLVFKDQNSFFRCIYTNVEYRLQQAEKTSRRLHTEVTTATLEKRLGKWNG